MLSPIDLEYRIQSAEYYFATLMDQVVDESMQLEPVDEAFISRVDNLFYTIEAIRFLFDRGIYTDNDTCLAVYQDMMDQIGINVTLPDVYVDTTLVIPGIVLPPAFQGPQGPVGPAGPQGVQGPRGFQGFQGVQGPQGFQGSGVQGPQGVPGPQGPQGFQGANGTSVVIKGVVQSVANLPSSGNTQGDLYIVLDDGDGYVWDGSQWDNIGQIQGPQGFQGPQGPQGFQGFQGPQGFQGSGTQGPQGFQGDQGPRGFQGFQGHQGPQGFQGVQGPQGPQGPQGTLFGGTLNTLSKFGGSNTLVNSNVSDTGSLVLSNSNTAINGGLVVGDSTGFFYHSLQVSRGLNSSVNNGVGVYQLGSAVSTAVGSISGFKNDFRLNSGANISTYIHYESAFGNKLGSATCLNEFGFVASLGGGTNKYAFYSSVNTAGGEDNWNVYALGTAPNYFNGNVVVGTTTAVGKLTVSGSIVGSSFVRTGGTSSQFLKADGSVDSNTYLTSTGTAGYVPVFSGPSGLSNSNIQLAADETIGAMVGIGASPNSSPGYPNRLYVNGTSYFSGSITTSGAISTSQSVTAAFFIRPGGTASQFLKADGNVDATIYTPASRTLTINGVSYDLTGNRSWTVGNMTGSGVANYIPKFSGSTSLTNGMLYDIGTGVGVNTTNPLATLHVAGGFIMENQYNRVTSAYTLVLTDAGKVIEMNVLSDHLLTVPLNSSVPFPIGTEIFVIQFGPGATTVFPQSGVVIYSDAGKTRIGNRYKGACLLKTGTDEWYLVGSLI